MRRLLLNALTVPIVIVAMLGLAEAAIPYLVTLRDVGTPFTQYDPVMWKRLKPNFSTVRVTPEFTMKFGTNSLGARGPEPPSPLKGPVLFLGDSFTMGYGVSDGQEFPALVQQALRRQMSDQAPFLLNLGLGGSGNGFWLKHLTHTAPQVQPRLVVLQVLENDFWDNQVERLFDLDKDGRLVELPVPLPGLGRRVQNVIETIPGLAGSNFVGLVRLVVSSDLATTFAAPAVSQATNPAPVKSALGPGDALTLRIVEAALQRCRQSGWPVVLLSVGLPPPQKEAMRRLAEANSAHVLELPSKQERPDLYFLIDGHWNAKGNADTAQRLLASLAELKLLTP